MKRKSMAIMLAASLSIGIIPMTAMAASGTGTTIQAASAQATTATVKKGVSFRTGPSTSASRIRYLQTGETVRILEKTNSYWYKVQDKIGKTGYVSSSSTYITISAQSPSGGQASGNGQTTTKPDAPASTADAKAQLVINAGMKYWGTPYEFGSSRNNTSTFDCSAFVRQAFLDALNLNVGGDSRKQADFVKKVGKTSTDWRQLKPGDLMFFMSYKGSKASDYSGLNKQAQTVTHVGIYLGNGQILHTYSKESGGVRTNAIAGTAWEYRFIFGGSAY